MKKELSEDEKEYKAIQRNFRIVAGVAFATLFIGATFYHLVERLTWINAFYFSTITLTTVGYGDIVPHTDAEKLFTMGYVVVGIGILATFANLLVKNAVARRELKRKTKVSASDKS